MVREAIVFEQEVDQWLVAFSERCDRLEKKMTTRFCWIVGIQVTTCAVTIATILIAGLAR